MKILIAYDIIQNKNRNKIIDILFDYGFERVQGSIFIGEIKNKKLKRLIHLASKVIDIKEDSLYFFHLNKEEFDESKFLGKILNIRYLNEEIIFL